MCTASDIRAGVDCASDAWASGAFDGLSVHAVWVIMLLVFFLFVVSSK